MRVLSWAHKRYRLLNALATLDSNVASRAALLREHWAHAPALVDAAPSKDPPASTANTRALSPALAAAAATVEATQALIRTPANPMRGEVAPTAATTTPAPVRPTSTIPGIAPGEPVPEYLQ
jgi:hypothetical protein